MQGNVVTAARWLGGSLVLASAILVGGIKYALSHETVQTLRTPPINEAKSLGDATTETPNEVVGWSSDPSKRLEALKQQSEDLSKISEEWKRIWFTDQPSHLTADVIVALGTMPYAASDEPNARATQLSGPSDSVAPARMPYARSDDLPFQSEDYGPRNIGSWKEIWSGQPSHLTPDRVHGGIQ